jgi:uncharacterized protein (TIGR02444 family)
MTFLHIEHCPQYWTSGFAGKCKPHYALQRLRYKGGVAAAFICLIARPALVRRSSLTVMTATAVSTPIWDFVLNYYGRKGVSEALIGLQDDHGIDVNMLLFLAWMAAQGRCLAPDDVKFVSTTSHAWQRSVVVPIRAVRRLLKENVPLVPADAAAAFRKKVQTIELEGEQLQLNAMAALVERFKPTAAGSPEEAARRNIKTFETVAAKSFPPATVDTLARALAEVADGR